MIPILQCRKLRLKEVEILLDTGVEKYNNNGWGGCRKFKPGWLHEDCSCEVELGFVTLSLLAKVWLTSFRFLVLLNLFLKSSFYFNNWFQ